MSLSLELAKRPSLHSFELHLDATANARAGIKVYGAGVSGSGLASVGIKSGGIGFATAGIAAPSIEDPTNPLTVHLAQGTLLFTWDHPSPERVRRYELTASALLNGTYFPYQRGNFPGGLHGRRGVVNNVPLGITAYFRLRAVGINGAFSSYVQVKLGKLNSITAPFKVRGIVGSQIPAGGTFTSLDQETGQAIAIRTLSLITI